MIDVLPFKTTTFKKGQMIKEHSLMIKFKDLLNYQLSTDTIGYSKAAASKKNYNTLYWFCNLYFLKCEHSKLHVCEHYYILFKSDWRILKMMWEKSLRRTYFEKITRFVLGFENSWCCCQEGHNLTYEQWMHIIWCTWKN